MWTKWTLTSAKPLLSLPPFLVPEKKAQQQKTEVSKATHQPGCQGETEVSSKLSECCRQVNYHGKRGSGSWDCLIWRGKGSGRPYQGGSISHWEGRGRQSKTHLSGAQWQDKQWPQTEIQENHFQQKKTPFILLWMIKHCNRLSREAVNPPALELLKTQTRFGPEQPVPADGALSIGLDYRPSEAPSNLNYSMIPRCWTETRTQHQNQAASAIKMLDLIWILIFP